MQKSNEMLSLINDLVKYGNAEYKKMIQTVLDTEVKPYEPNKKLN